MHMGALGGITDRGASVEGRLPGLLTAAGVGAKGQSASGSPATG